mmetsp:Transcript_47148/g.106852  ORF Transcript_47148/g.106852 Transcript_47148/m.106852 type:complete len:320 (-) Transcript_47148:406-1365(-)
MPAKSDKANPKNAVGVDLVSTPEQAQAVPLNFYEIQIPKGETRLRLRDLVVLPCVLYRVAKYFFGATRRSLPISAIMGCVGGILAIGVLNQNLLDFLGIINESFGIKFGTMRRGIRLMGSIVLIVDGSVLSHGAIVASLSLKHYLCGPKGKIKSCRPRLGDQPEPRSWLRCFCCCCCRMLQCCWRQCIPRAARCFLQALRATVRGAFAVAAAVLLWVSIIMLVVIIVASSFCFILVLAVNAVSAHSFAKFPHLTALVCVSSTCSALFSSDRLRVQCTPLVGVLQYRPFGCRSLLATKCSSDSGKSRLGSDRNRAYPTGL